MQPELPAGKGKMERFVMPFSATLHRVGDNKFRQDSTPCVLLVHNEAHILRDVLRHYRQFDHVSFLVVDDRSDDATHELLRTAPDVTVFQPSEGTTYAQHKRQWRQELLDYFGANRWCLVPDADEKLIWTDFEDRPFRELLNDLETEGAEAFVCTMVDMYCDGTVAAQVYSGEKPLEIEFSFFDDQKKDPLCCRLFASAPFFRKKYPAPRMQARGGMRDRLFFSENRDRSTFIKHLFKLLGATRNPNPKGMRLVCERLLRLLLRSPNARLPEIVLTKIGLIKWKPGSCFSGGAHAVSKPYKISSETGVFLHFPITRGETGVRYLVDRGQHVAGGAYYKAILDSSSGGHPSLFYEGSSKYTSSRSVEAFMRPPKFLKR